MEKRMEIGKIDMCILQMKMLTNDLYQFSFAKFYNNKLNVKLQNILLHV